MQCRHEQDYLPQVSVQPAEPCKSEWSPWRRAQTNNTVDRGVSPGDGPDNYEGGLLLCPWWSLSGPTSVKRTLARLGR